MKCDNCTKESQWLEIIGGQFICHKCLQKNKLMGNVLRTHMDSFLFILKKLNITDYEKYMKIEKQDLKGIVEVSKVLNLK